MLEFYLYKFGEFLACIFPLGVAYRIGKLLSTMQFYISKKDRDAVISNLKVILPNENKTEIRRIAKKVFVNFGLYLVEFCRFKCIDLNFINNNFTFKGKDIIDQALKEGKGAILLTGHIGNWEVGGMALSLLGYPLMVVALEHKNKRINDFFKERRESKGMEIVPLGIAIKRCYKGLKANKLMAILGDRDFSDTGYPIDFLGKSKIIPRGPAVLALRTGAPIIPVMITRQGLDRLTLECLPPLRITSDSNEKEIMKDYAKIIENQIYKSPSQWLMFREFWKE